MFDPPAEVPYASIPMSVVNSPAHRALAYEAALKSIVLLKNKNNVLPVSDRIKSICVVGPNAASADILLGNYYGISDTLTTLIEGIVSRAPEGIEIEYRPGCLLTQPSANPNDWSVYQAASADLTFACMGISPLLEGEEGDALLTKENGDRSDDRPARRAGGICQEDGAARRAHRAGAGRRVADFAGRARRPGGSDCVHLVPWAGRRQSGGRRPVWKG